jgi:hypothetical protein
MALYETYGNYSRNVEQFYSTKEGGRTNFSSFQDIQMPLAGDWIAMWENPSDSTKDLNLARIVISSEAKTRWRRRRTLISNIPNRGPILPNGNRGGGLNVAAGKFYNMVGVSVPANILPEKGVFLPSWEVYNVPELGCIVLRPGQCIIWHCIPNNDGNLFKVGSLPWVSFEIVWWETDKKGD